MDEKISVLVDTPNKQQLNKLSQIIARNIKSVHQSLGMSGRQKILISSGWINIYFVIRKILKNTKNISNYSLVLLFQINMK